MNWAQEQRLKWIGDMLRVYGFINRDHICKMFRVSVPQASADLKKFNIEWPGVAVYDKRIKQYVMNEKTRAE